MPVQKNGISVVDVQNAQHLIVFWIGALEVKVKYDPNTNRFRADKNDRRWLDGRRGSQDKHLDPEPFREMMDQARTIARDHHWDYKGPS
jgi:hypothetical protein